MSLAQSTSWLQDQSLQDAASSHVLLEPGVLVWGCSLAVPRGLLLDVARDSGPAGLRLPGPDFTLCAQRSHGMSGWRQGLGAQRGSTVAAARREAGSGGQRWCQHHPPPGREAVEGPVP